MKKQSIQFNKIKLLGLFGISCLGYLAFISPHESVEAVKSVATHIGTFEGSTTFTTSSSNGINPGLFIEVMDEDGTLTQYESEEGIITIPNTQEGAYVTQAKLLGKTKYVDEETDEILDQFEEGRNLRLESVEKPVLTTTGKNLFNHNIEPELYYFSKNGKYEQTTNLTINQEVNVKDSSLTFSFSNKIGDAAYIRFGELDKDKKFIKRTLINTSPTTIFLNDKTEYVVFSVDASDEWYFENLQIEQGEQETTYEPYQSNILTVNEDVTLRGVGNERDELDLLTGEYIQRVGEVVFDGSDDEGWRIDDIESENHLYVDTQTQGTPEINPLSSNYRISDKFNSISHEEYLAGKEGIRYFSIPAICISKSKLNVGNLEGFKQYLQSNPITVQYELKIPVIKTVRLNSDYFFEPINKKSIQVTGTITPLVGSVTVPTTPVSFVLDPNQEVGQQFIAPEFSVSNEGNAPIKLALNSFEQTTNVLTDVLPDKYNSWEGLNKKESKDIALALVPKVSDGWVSLTEGPRYVAEASDTDLGVVKAKSRVDFTFSACHGQAFEETLNPSYRLGFVFEFMN